MSTEQTGGVPDSSDYEDFWALLARPTTWTSDERRMIEHALVTQQQLLDSWHPKDLKRRASLAKIVEDIRAALAATAR